MQLKQYQEAPNYLTFVPTGSTGHGINPYDINLDPIGLPKAHPRQKDLFLIPLRSKWSSIEYQKETEPINDLFLEYHFPDEVLPPGQARRKTFDPDLARKDPLMACTRKDLLSNPQLLEQIVDESSHIALKFCTILSGIPLSLEIPAKFSVCAKRPQSILRELAYFEETGHKKAWLAAFSDLARGRMTVGSFADVALVTWKIAERYSPQTVLALDLFEYQLYNGHKGSVHIVLYDEETWRKFELQVITKDIDDFEYIKFPTTNGRMLNIRNALLDVLPDLRSNKYEKMLMEYRTLQRRIIDVNTRGGSVSSFPELTRDINHFKRKIATILQGS